MKYFKSIIQVTVLMSSIAKAPAMGCQLEVNGQPVKHFSLKPGSATVANENGTDTVLIACGEFSAQVNGIERVERLKPGMCSLISNSGQLSLFDCEQ